MKTSDAERMVHAVLVQNAEQQSHAAMRLGAAVATGQREATEVTRLEAARRERIEAESIVRIAAARATDLKQRQQLERPLAPRTQDNRRSEISVRPPEVEIFRNQKAARSAYIPPPQSKREEATHDAGVERPDQNSVAAATPERSRLELQVKAKRELIVKLEDDSQALVESVVHQVEILMEERDALIVEQVKRQLVDFAIQRNNAIPYTGGGN